MRNEAREALDEAMEACGIDPEERVVVAPEQCTPENRRRLAEVTQVVIFPLVAKAREVAE